MKIYSRQVFVLIEKAFSRNTVGNIPLNWYDDYDHLGYDWDGKPIRKPKRGDELDKFLNKMDNPEHGITVTDPTTGTATNEKWDLKFYPTI